MRCFVSAAVCLAHGCRNFVFATRTTHPSKDCKSSLTQIFGGVSAPSLPFALCTFALVCSVLLCAALFRFAPAHLLFLCSTLCCSTFYWSVGVRTEPVAQMYSLHALTFQANTITGMVLRVKCVVLDILGAANPTQPSTRLEH